MAKRPAGGGQQDPPNPGPRRARGKALEYRVVFTVDGDELGPALVYRLHEETPGHDQRFLVGEQHPLSGARRGEGREQPRRAHDPGQHVADLRQGDHFLEGRGAGEHGGRGAGEPAPELGRGRFIHEHRELGTVRTALHLHGLDAGPGREGNDPIAVRMPGDHRQGVCSDGPRGPENRQPFDTHRAAAPARMPQSETGRAQMSSASAPAAARGKPLARRYQATTIAYTGAAAVRPSIRSRIPPWPGSRRPLSFTLARRLAMLS